MKKISMHNIIIFLVVLSISFYLLQMAIFRTPGTTLFYILQDAAFLPLTVAITTVVIGEMISRREAGERREKTRMLTSTFFTETGLDIMLKMLKCSESLKLIDETITRGDVRQAEVRIRDMDLGLHLNREIYEGVKELVDDDRTNLMILSSNPMILEQECFTQMLWGLFHLMDEFSLRGSYEQLSEDDKRHIESDMTKVLRHMLINWVSNAEYLARAYPDYYSAGGAQICRRV